MAFGSVMLLIASGTGAAIVHLPTLASLWQTSYGKALIVKIVLLAAAMLLAAVNLARTKPRLEASRARPDLAAGAAVLLRRLVAGFESGRLRPFPIAPTAVYPLARAHEAYVRVLGSSPDRLVIVQCMWKSCGKLNLLGFCRCARLFLYDL